MAARASMILCCVAAACAPSRVQREPALDRPRAERETPLDDPAAVERIRALYASVNAAIDQERCTARYFLAPFDGDWVRDPSGGTDVTTAGHRGVRYACPDGTTRARVGLVSQGRDWSNTADHYYYPSGRLAFRFERHETYSGAPPEDAERVEAPYVIDRRSYFDERGKLVREIESAQTSTKRKLRSSAGIERIDEPPYLRVADLPFPK